MSDITKYFRLNGVNIRSDAAHYLASVIKEKSKSEQKSILEQVVRYVQNQAESSVVVSKDVVEIAVKEFAFQDDASGGDFFWVIDAFDTPRFAYDSDRKHFFHASVLNQPIPNLHEEGKWKNQIYVERYEALFYRTMRNPAFIRSSFEHGDVEGKFVLHVIEELLSSSVRIPRAVVLGMVSSLQEQKYHLEDPTGSIELDICPQSSFHVGLYTENIFVIVEGFYEDRVFYATGFGMPPAETRATTQLLFGDFNFFGGPPQVSLKSSGKMKRLEEKYADAMFVIMSDLWLDKPEVLAKLSAVFRGFDANPPFCFIFCGDFVSESENLNHGQMLKSGLKALSDILRNHANIHKYSKLVFVPGPNDAGLSGILPRPRLPSNLTHDFENVAKNATFTSNPCRIQFCTKEIVVIREDILTKMCRTLIKDPKGVGNESRFKTLTSNLAKTILKQGHICPLPAHVLPTYWSFDHAFRLYAIPDLVVVADIQEPFDEKEFGCLVASPSSFPRHKFQFHVYMPSQNTIDLSQID